MPQAMGPEPAWPDRAFDLMRGVAAYSGNGLLSNLAKCLCRHPGACLDNAFNHKQVASKLWARDRLFETLGGSYGCIWIMGGWYGVLAAMLFDDTRFTIGAIRSFDIDPAVAAVAVTLNANNAFTPVTADMYALDYRGAARPDLIINTSCEHIADLRGWLDLLAPGTPVLLQSNDYYAEPTHINSKPSLEAFAADARLAEVLCADALKLPHYTRFMLIGRV
ncbi:hypothetical protein BH10PSE7_BH10PSE7_36340 [soil metagenome]